MPVPDLDALIAEVDRNCATATPGDGRREQPEWIELLNSAAALAAQLQALGDDLIEEYIEHCRMHGVSWAEIGEVLGITRQAVQQRFRSPAKEYEPSEFADELRNAMAAMKTVAVQQRNNYIGTEHVLWGITAEDNSATALLKRLGVPVNQLREVLAQRLTQGASQAAERIAWTPYSRKAIALAKEFAEEAGSPVIDCQHVLVALVDMGRGVASDVLAQAGADRNAVHLKLRRPKKTRK
ncbi:MAG: Clp protease N-terminal domain-containing protein [Acidimicrobiales bacterium]